MVSKFTPGLPRALITLLLTGPSLSFFLSFSLTTNQKQSCLALLHPIYISVKGTREATDSV